MQDSIEDTSRSSLDAVAMKGQLEGQHAVATSAPMRFFTSMRNLQERAADIGLNIQITPGMPTLNSGRSLQDCRRLQASQCSRDSAKQEERLAEDMKRGQRRHEEDQKVY